MADIARITFNSSTDFYEVMDMLDKRLNDKGKNWRHVFKSLTVLDYILHAGSDNVVQYFRCAPSRQDVPFYSCSTC